MKRVFLVILVTLLLAACGGGAKAPTRGDVLVFVAVPRAASRPMVGRRSWVGCGWRQRRSTGTVGCKAIGSSCSLWMTNRTATSLLAQVEAIRAAVQSGQRVVGVIGHLNSGQTLAAMTLYADMDLVVITPTASSRV